MASRTYFFDALTGEELKSFRYNGAQSAGMDAAGGSERTGVQYDDTAWSVEVMVGRKLVKITAADFPGRLVYVKDWAPGNGPRARSTELRLLIAAGDGFSTLDKVTATGTLRRDGDGTTYRDHVRSTILGNRAALEWIAARRAKGATVAA